MQAKYVNLDTEFQEMKKKKNINDNILFTFI